MAKKRLRGEERVTSGAPQLLLEQYRSNPSKPSVLEQEIAGILEKGEKFASKELDNKHLLTVIELLDTARSIVLNAATKLEPYDWGGMEAMDGIARLRSTAQALSHEHTLRRSTRRRSGTNLDIHRREAIEMAIRNLSSRSPKLHWGLMVQPPSSVDLPNAAADFVAAIAYTKGLRFGNWYRTRERYRRTTRELCATVNTAAKPKTS